MKVIELLSVINHPATKQREIDKARKLLHLSVQWGDGNVDLVNAYQARVRTKFKGKVYDFVVDLELLEV
jgi:hypothetical protein